jgi:hypothetical protein
LRPNSPVLFNDSIANRKSIIISVKLKDLYYYETNIFKKTFAAEVEFLL